MSESDGPSEYKVGHGKPPIDSQFKKRRSGNPKGRPRKPPDPREDVQLKSVNALILAESERLVPLTGGGKPVSLPAAQAVFRALLASAGKGNVHAQRAFLQLVVNAQAHKDKVQSETLRLAYGLKLDLEISRTSWLAQGGNEMSMVLHPSDVEIDWQTGQVKLYWAVTCEERAARALLLRMLDEGQAVLLRSIATIAEDGDDRLLEIGREIAERQICIVNEHLPSRFRRPPIRPKTFTIDPTNPDHARWNELALAPPKAGLRNDDA